jgi:NitT/TauT family transport system permease protein
VVLIGLWQLAAALNTTEPASIVGPWPTAQAFVDGWADGDLASSTLTTLRLLGLSMLIGMAVAAVLTTFAQWTRLGQDVLTLLTSILNPLPGIAVLPFAILWFGLSESAIVFVVANAVVWPIAANISTGFRTVPPTLTMVGRNIGLRGVRLVRDVLIPAALPSIITGLKTGWAFGWRTIIAAEIVFGVSGAKGGLGFYINDARTFLNVDAGFAGIVSIAIIGIALESAFGLLERRTVVRWGMKAVA